MSVENNFDGQAQSVAQFGHAEQVNVYPRPKRTKWFAIGYVVAALAVFAGVGVYWATRPPELEAVADYHREVALPSVVTAELVERNAFPSAQGCHSVIEWLVARGATYASKNPVRLYLRGRSVDVNRIRVVVTERAEAPAGTLFRCAPSGGVEVVQLAADLDEASPVVRSVDKAGTVGEIYGEKTAISLQDEAMFFDIAPKTTKCICKWHIQIERYQDGKLATTVVKAPDGKDFVTAAVGNVRREYSARGSLWTQTL